VNDFPLVTALSDNKTCSDDFDYDNAWELPLHDGAPTDSDTDDEANAYVPRAIRAMLPATANQWAPFSSEKEMQNAIWIKDSITTRSAADQLAAIHKDDPNFNTSGSLSAKILTIAQIYPQLDSGAFRPITLRKILYYTHIHDCLR